MYRKKLRVAMKILRRLYPNSTFRVMQDMIIKDGLFFTFREGDWIDTTCLPELD